MAVKSSREGIPITSPSNRFWSVDEPGGVDFADVEVEPELVLVLFEVLDVGEAGVVATGSSSSPTTGLETTSMISSHCERST